MLKPADKVSFRLMSELPGCNVSERWESLVKVNFRWSSRYLYGEDSMSYYFRLAKAVEHTGAKALNRLTVLNGVNRGLF